MRAIEKGISNGNEKGALICGIGGEIQINLLYETIYASVIA